jgi:NADP-dependent 3-hydroxy acid dehydrogenase YdfG
MIETTESQTTNTTRGALVTGASRGIGKEIALDLAKQHFNVGLAGREAALLEEVAAQCRSLGVKASCFVVDLTDADAVAKLAGQAASELGGISVLVNNAGVSIEKDIRSASVDEWNTTLDVNLRAVFLLTKFCLPYLERAEKAAVITIASIASNRTYPGGTMYAASKHGVRGFSNALFDDVREAGIKVCSIMPGYVNTAMHEGDTRLDPEKMLQPADVAKAVSFVVNFPENGCPTEITLMPQRSPKKLL